MLLVCSHVANVEISQQGFSKHKSQFPVYLQRGRLSQRTVNR